jgi:hypothetical protein
MTRKFLHGCFSVLFFALLPDAWADARKDRFRKGSNPNQFIAFGGTRKTDHNSKQNDFVLTYQFKNDRFLHEFDLRQRTTYSATTTKEMRKSEELYDAEISSKMMILNSPYYFNFYNRSKYNEFSSFYYDVTTASGLGRTFFDKAIYFDMNIGWNDVKNGNSELVINPSMRLNLKLTKNIDLTEVGYILQREETYDEQLKTRLSYRLNERIYLQFYHTYEKNRYIYHNKKLTEIKTEASRSYVFRIKYDF